MTDEEIVEKLNSTLEEVIKCFFIIFLNIILFYVILI